jgi:hypothetical protein
MEFFEQVLVRRPPKWAAILGAWLPFWVLLGWGWRINPFTHVPSYGDTLEVIWGGEWYMEHLLTWQNPLYDPLLFHPVGWHTALLPHGIPLLAVLGFLGWLWTSAFAYNAITLVSFAVAYTGMRRYLSLYTREQVVILVVALVYTFWGMRWVRIHGHMHVLLTSSLLPWFAWCVMRQSRGRGYLLGAGLIWAVMLSISLYSVWFGGVVLVLYLLTRLRFPKVWEAFDLRPWGRSAVIGLIAGGLAAPLFYLFVRARSASEAPFYSLEHISYWGASLNSLFIPALTHPWGAEWSRMFYNGPRDEAALINYGLVASLVVASLTLRSAQRPPDYRYAWLLFGVGTILALGPTLRWSGETVQVPFLQPLNFYLWQLGQIFKPHLFEGMPPPIFWEAVPLPAWLAMIFVPFMEGARTISRFALVGALGFFPLVALGLGRIRPAWLRYGIMALLILEILPPPVTTGRPWPPTLHPAYTWMIEQSSAGQPAGIAELVVERDQFLVPHIGGEILYGTMLHHRPTVGGVGALWPRQLWHLSEWLHQMPMPLSRPEVAVILRYYQVRWVLLYMSTQAQVHFQQRDTLAFRSVGCFDPPSDPANLWPYPICVLEIPPWENPRLNLIFVQGWSDAEAWGRWAIARRAQAVWVAPLAESYRLTAEAFPHCLPGKAQTVEISLNRRPVGRLAFEACQPLTREFIIPAEQVVPGQNFLEFKHAYATLPLDGSDPRSLAVGYTRLELTPLRTAP